MIDVNDELRDAAQAVVDKRWVPAVLQDLIGALAAVLKEKKDESSATSTTTKRG